jgi:uncharacterized protein YabN with tetrapyrrole methylase and pyrophosphatase domain
MKDDLLKIISFYGVIPQLKYFQSEVFEMNESIIKREAVAGYETEYLNSHDKHIAEEIADISVMLKQFQYYYEITDEEIIKVMKEKIDRQLERIENEKSNNIST